MKITNNLGLPQPLVDVVSKDYQYKDNQYSVTSLLKGTCEVLLSRRHNNDIEQDASDMIWAIFGSAVHKVLEAGQESEHQLKEDKIVIDVGKYKLSGIFDLYDAHEKKVIDWKTASCWKVIYKDWEDYRTQLLMYAYMLRMIGFECNKGEIVAILKDHSKLKAKTDSTYPQYPVHRETFDFNENDFKEIEEFIKTKFADIEKYESASDNDLPPCTDKERWATPNKYAVMKKGNKRAVKLCDSEDEAQEYIESKKLDKHFIEFRKGENKKCNEYCRVNCFCPFYRKEQENDNI